MNFRRINKQKFWKWKLVHLCLGISFLCFMRNMKLELRFHEPQREKAVSAIDNLPCYANKPLKKKTDDWDWKPRSRTSIDIDANLVKDKTRVASNHKLNFYFFFLYWYRKCTTQTWALLFSLTISLHYIRGVRFWKRKKLSAAVKWIYILGRDRIYVQSAKPKLNQSFCLFVNI